jgi:chemotaxis-related protein WspB
LLIDPVATPRKIAMLFLLFQLGADRYALDVSQVVEVLPMVRIRVMLRSPPGVAGTINYRGAHVPVVDLNELALGRPTMPRLSTRIILVNSSEQGGKSRLKSRLLGLIAENATETMRKEPGDFAPSGIDNSDAPYLGPIAMGPHGMVQRIELNGLLSTSMRCSLFKESA